MKNSSKLQVYNLLESKKGTYVAYLVLDTVTDTETGEIKTNATHIWLASWTTEDWVKKIYTFGRDFGIFQNSETVWIKTAYIDEEKKNKILAF